MLSLLLPLLLATPSLTSPLSHESFLALEALQTRQTTTTCATSAHLIVTRGSTEAPGNGRIDSVAQLVLAALPGSDNYSTVYPATITNPDYNVSESQGAAAVQKSIVDYATSCPHTPIALLGYSQGGQATLDGICGTSSANFSGTSTPLDPKFQKNVKAVVTYGETSHVPGQTWDFGTSTLPGLFPRLDPAACDPFASKIRDYCNFDDPFCASGGNLTVHLEDYFLQYDKEAADFIIAQVTGT